MSKLTGMEKKKLHALIELLDDPDAAVFDVVEKELLKETEKIIPELEKKWESTFDDHYQARIENLIQQLHFKKTTHKLKSWLKNKARQRDLLVGFSLVDTFQYPDLSFMNVQLKIENIRKSIWLELNNSLTLLEKTTILNHYLYNINGFTVNHNHPHSPQNCFLNQMLDTKKGNPVSVAILYTLIARSLEIPAELVDFPKNPLVAIVDSELAGKVHGKGQNSDVLFYINPSNKGAVTSRKEIDYHLRKHEFEPLHLYTEPQPDSLFIKRLLESLKDAYKSVAFAEKEAKIEELLQLFNP
jgi:regulator of sirC expression with transglutaminase-like and TPR domain